MARGFTWTLTKAHDAGQLVRVVCQHCRITRYFYPADLRELMGDIGVDRIEGKMTCQQCGSREWLEAHFDSLTAVQRQKLPVRKLVRIKTIRRAVWRDEWP